ncbi:MAG: DUF2203 domain-containing protein [Actinomycetota bacterium]|nr:DUF2203 domain-containing protein [Actinomycetota bacterium]
MSDPGPGAEERRFTVEEANAMLPELRESLARMREARQLMLRSGERVRETVAGNGGGPEGREYTEAAQTLKDGVERLSGEGIVLRDVEEGLADFPSTREGRLVFLCWRLGEDTVAYWHDVDTGFPGRRPLD